MRVWENGGEEIKIRRLFDFGFYDFTILPFRYLHEFWDEWHNLGTHGNS